MAKKDGIKWTGLLALVGAGAYLKHKGIVDFNVKEPDGKRTLVKINNKKKEDPIKEILDASKNQD